MDIVHVYVIYACMCVGVWECVGGWECVLVSGHVE